MAARILTVIAIAIGLTAGVLAPPTPAVAAESSTSAVYRFYSPEFKGHFYTMSVAERDHIITSYPTSTWTYEGGAYSAFATQVPGTVPLYRFWSAEFRGHFFTTNEDEKNLVIANYDDSTWLFEGVAYYVYPATSSILDTRAVSRFWSPQNRHHFYTANDHEAELVKTTYPPHIWTYENQSFRVPSSAPVVVPAPAPLPPPIRFGEGTHLVGSEVPAGVYRSEGGDGCYWERKSGLGGTYTEIIANSFSMGGPQLVDIAPSDVAFETSGCASWISIGLHKPSSPASQFGDGMFLMGTDVAPGTYRATPTSYCYWARLSGVGGTIDDVISNGFTANPTVTIALSAGDRAVESSGCGTWTRIA
ncbi:hypothetical protein [Salinibacterium sp. ZJ454]|uniref:hypothetical protein n=1 Tax=Salinibacterium sp. ZJ454 TaxID=2708339 RepID=UPI001420A1AD|nr:hypothetical protein [Salinibacterium sp. ZJ454]